ncbi:MAG TPA: hypothetical protein VF623_03725, partial [Segetibacter sp.]
RLCFLLNKIPENYILYLQEDMWLNEDVNSSFFSQLFALVEANSWKQVKLNSSQVYKTIQTPVYINGFNIARVDNKSSDYLMSHQITLWDKQHLFGLLGKGEHPWRNERKGTKRLRRMNSEIFHADYFIENGMPENNINSPSIKRSGYWTISQNGSLNSRVLSYITVLEKGTLTEKKYACDLLHHLENGLTHDGKQKPRKEDLFKKMKNWLLRK